MLLTFTSCDTSQQGEVTQQTLEPVKIKEWSGTGTKTTEAFTISGSQWAISWGFNPDSPTYGVYANFFSIETYKSGGTFPIDLTANIANTNQNLSDVSYIHQSGTFYLNITSMSGNWKVVVYDYQ